MDTTHLRYVIAGIFVAFIAFVVLADLWKRLPKIRTKAPRQTGFTRGTPINAQRQPHSSWKNGVRR